MIKYNLDKLSLISSDYELSNKFYKRFNRVIKRSQCYMNIATITLGNLSELKHTYPDITVIYGGAQIMPKIQNNLFCCHAFFKINNKIVDPTFCLNNNNYDEDYKYFSIIEFKIEEYVEFLKKNNYFPCPYNIEIYLNSKSIEVHQKHHIILLGNQG